MQPLRHGRRLHRSNSRKQGLRRPDVHCNASALFSCATVAIVAGRDATGASPWGRCATGEASESNDAGALPGVPWSPATLGPRKRLHAAGRPSIVHQPRRPSRLVLRPSLARTLSLGALRGSPYSKGVSRSRAKGRGKAFPLKLGKAATGWRFTLLLVVAPTPIRSNARSFLPAPAANVPPLRVPAAKPGASGESNTSGVAVPGGVDNGHNLRLAGHSRGTGPARGAVVEAGWCACGGVASNGVLGSSKWVLGAPVRTGSTDPLGARLACEYRYSSDVGRHSLRIVSCY